MLSFLSVFCKVYRVKINRFFQFGDFGSEFDNLPFKFQIFILRFENFVLKIENFRLKFVNFILKLFFEIKFFFVWCYYFLIHGKFLHFPSFFEPDESKDE